MIIPIAGPINIPIVPIPQHPKTLWNSFFPSTINTITPTIIKKPQKYRTAYEILFWCGIRIGELLAMNVGDIQFNNNLLSINKNYAKLDNQELILTPKTKKSKRLVEIPHFLAEHIKEYLTHIYDYDNDTRLFTISRPALRVNLNQYAKQAGVKQIRLHDLRHSHASLLIEFLGCSPNVVSDRLGHANVKTTLQTYAHLYPHTQTVICEKLEKLK